jgi:hypothetical protein
MASVSIAPLTCSKPQKREYSRQLGIHPGIPTQALHLMLFGVLACGEGELCIYFANLDRLTRIIAIEPSQTEAEALAANLGCNSIAPNSVELLQKFCGTKGDHDHIQLGPARHQP